LAVRQNRVSVVLPVFETSQADVSAEVSGVTFR
jgi:hypothetical protein